jgi:cell fate (sporulation/competence/biofilm development) regulator YlbF (YheA/YmcA/DUF963 family)
MEPLEYIAIATAALKLYQSLQPQIKALFQSGELSAEQLTEIRARYDAIDHDYDLPEYKDGGA